VNDFDVNEEHPLTNVLTNFKPGDKVTLTILRNSRNQQVQVTLGQRPSQP
jgi:S1-C subfamily serine protease